MPWKAGVSSPNLGVAQRYGSFAILLCELCSALWSTIWHEVRILEMVQRYLLRCGFDTIVLWFQLVDLSDSSSLFQFVACHRVLTAWFMGLQGGQCVTLYK